VRCKISLSDRQIALCSLMSEYFNGWMRFCLESFYKIFNFLLELDECIVEVRIEFVW